MKELKNKFSVIYDRWEVVYANCLKHDVYWKSSLSGCTVTDINILMLNIKEWLDRARVPKGYRPALNVIKSLILTSLLDTHNSLEPLNRGQFNPNTWNSFISNLGQVFSALHGMMYLATNTKDHDLLATSSELREASARIDAANKHLKTFHNMLESITRYHKEMNGGAIEITEAAREATDERNMCEDLRKNASDILNEIQSNAKLLDEKLKSAVELEQNFNLLTHEAEITQKVTLDLLQKNENINKTIKEILPKAATAGLALAFAERANEIYRSKWLWGILFFLSILVIFGVAYTVVLPNIETLDKDTYWIYILVRLPLITPFIWSAWFSSIQYGNVLRLKEDYDFKASTARAYIGFRDHLENLGENFDSEEIKKILTLLSGSTITTLSNEPSRALGKTQKDASPAQHLSEIIACTLKQTPKE